MDSLKLCGDVGLELPFTLLRNTIEMLEIKKRFASHFFIVSHCLLFLFKEISNAVRNRKV